MNKTYVVRLTDDEREVCRAILARGKGPAHRVRHASILLKVDADGPGEADRVAADATHCHTNTVRNVRQRFVERGFEAALERKKQDAPSRTRKLDGAAEARLIAESCSQAPDGRAKWTLQMLADRLVELKIVESICRETVRQVLKKTN